MARTECGQRRRPGGAQTGTPHLNAPLSRANLLTGQVQVLAPDGLGSVRLLVDAATRQILDTYRYAPFGGLLAGGTSDNNRRFTGEAQDATGLYYLRARWYDPATGRFLSRDPFPGLAALPQTQTQHPYAYVGNNPVLYVDPSEEFVNILISDAVGGVVGAGAYTLSVAISGGQFNLCLLLKHLRPTWMDHIPCRTAPATSTNSLVPRFATGRSCTSKFGFWWPPIP